ncbi:hypothetical protein WBG78_09300 [Chryseolinea sp. T2]|uniref:hypothetical protein n=1 Tax=Chryseolinea sp. T2 TaxID=3129255 RepID=UPI00307820B6
MKMLFPLLLFTTMLITNAAAQTDKQIVRLANLSIDPNQLERYNSFLKEEIETSL